MVIGNGSLPTGILAHTAKVRHINFCADFVAFLL
jgi:hypothetical protein